MMTLTACNGLQFRHGPPPIIEGAAVEAASANKLRLLRALAQDASIGGDRASDWYLITEAGFNFIDDQCRTYFDELFFLDRRSERIKTGLVVADKTTAAILAVTGATTPTMNIVAQAFGFAVHATDLIAGTYLYRLPPATTQGFVSKLQLRFRQEAAMARGSINSPTLAYYMIQRYLDLCLPPRIEAEIAKQINATTAVGVPGGPGAEALFSLETISAPSMEALRPPVIAPGPGPGRAPGPGSAKGPAPRDQIGPPPKPQADQPTLDAYRNIIVDYDPKVHTIARVEPILVKLCVPRAELRVMTEKTNALIQVYQQSAGAAITGKLTKSQLARLNNVPDCTPNGVRNFYEANRMPDGLNSPGVIKALNRVLQPDQRLSETTPVAVADVRTRIPEVRKAIAAKLKITSPFVSDQFTDDMLVEVFRRGL